MRRPCGACPKRTTPTASCTSRCSMARAPRSASDWPFVQNGPADLRISVTPDQASYGPHAPVQLDGARGRCRRPARGHQLVGGRERCQPQRARPQRRNHCLEPAADVRPGGLRRKPRLLFPGSRRPATALALDDLLLTQGWRRFVWKEVLAGQGAAAMRFVPEHGHRPGGPGGERARQPAHCQQPAHVSANAARPNHGDGHHRRRWAASALWASR